MQLHVPLIQQEQSMSCWHAAARMLYGYRHRACIHPLPATYRANTGLSASNFIQLALSIGLKTLPKVNMSYGTAFIEEILTSYGPIWAAGHWYGLPHIIVITGIDANGTLYVNDPGSPLPRTHDIGWFNDKIAKTVQTPMMYLP